MTATAHARHEEARASVAGYYAPPSGAPFSRYEVHRSADPNFTPSATSLLSTIGDPDITRFRDTTARPATTFTYRVVANATRPTR